MRLDLWHLSLNDALGFYRLLLKLFGATLRRGIRSERMKKAMIAAVGFIFLSFAAKCQAESGNQNILYSSASAWNSHNRSILLCNDLVKRQYTEYEHLRLTQDCILDTEAGMLKGGSIRARWQGSPFEKFKEEVFFEGEYRRLAGRTAYQGYLQFQSTLVPYSASTGNDLRDLRFRLGIPIVSGSDWQILPFAEYRAGNWARGLTQYSEKFIYQAGALGFLGQWRFFHVWTVEGEVAVGRAIRTQVKVPSFNFNSTLPNRGSQAFGISINYEIESNFRAVFRAKRETNKYGQSANLSGVTQPASKTISTGSALGIEYQF